MFKECESIGKPITHKGHGCAMNAILMAQLRSHLERAGISLLEARQVPPNDGGLALGQAWLARQAASTR